jgi:hypothetical protein
MVRGCGWWALLARLLAFGAVASQGEELVVDVVEHYFVEMSTVQQRAVKQKVIVPNRFGSQNYNNRK